MDNFIDITWLLEIAVTVIGILIARYLIPWLKEKQIEVGNADLDFWVTFAVQAAEEKFKAEAGSGLLKFDYAKTLLEKQGFTYDADLMEAIINAKVREFFNWDDYPESGGGTE